MVGAHRWRRRSPPVAAALVAVTLMWLVAACTADEPVTHPWRGMVETLPDLGDAPLVVTDEGAVRAAFAGADDTAARRESLGVPLPERPFGEVERTNPGFDVAPVTGFGLDEVEASVTVDGVGTAYRTNDAPTAAWLAERGWTVRPDGERLLARPEAVAVDGARRSVVRALARPMLVDGDVVAVGEELATAWAREEAPADVESLHRVLGEVAAHRAEVAVVVFDGYRPQRPYALEWLEHYPVGAVAAAGPADERELLVVLWHDDDAAAQANAARLGEWLDFFVANSVNIDERSPVERDGRLVRGRAAIADGDVLMTLHRYRALPIGTVSPRRD